jgi:hypothetical protein
MKRRTLVTLIALFLLAASTPRVQAFDDNSFEAVAADAIVVRPMGFVATVLGSALFVISLPVAAISGSTHQTAEALVAKPARFTFTRPLGDLTSMTSN